MKILIVKISSLGDILQSFPVVEYLRKRFPIGLTIDWAVEEEYLEMIEAHPMVDRAIQFPTRKWRKSLWKRSTWRSISHAVELLRSTQYDLLFDIQGNMKSALLSWIARADVKVGFGRKSVVEHLNIYATDQHIEVAPDLNVWSRNLSLVQTFFKDSAPFVAKGIYLRCTDKEKIRLEQLLENSSRPRYMVASFSRWPNKQLAISSLAELIKRIAIEKNPFFYFIWNSAAEKKIADWLHSMESSSLSVGALSVPLWQALMKEMDLLLAVDSSALALSAISSTPSVSFFGPTSAQIYNPPGAHHRAWQGSCPYRIKFSMRCPFLRSCPTGNCLKTASVETLANFYFSQENNI